MSLTQLLELPFKDLKKLLKPVVRAANKDQKALVMKYLKRAKKEKLKKHH
ncbi:MAG: hypothetical protein WC843_01000 [Candidatus Gracilibacteria bacterium]|jgi:hypothetical protein